jgi:excisionase family DNA binding protein
MELIVTTAKELEAVINRAVSSALNSKTQPQVTPDRCTLDDALELTGLSKSKLYKLTSSKEIPHKRFGNRLIFSRKVLVAWIESQTLDKNNGEVVLALAKSARKKKGANNA